MVDESALRRRFTGMVVASLLVEPDVRAGTVTCGRCEAAPDRSQRDATLTEGDRIVAVATNYENHSWEFVDVYCPDHAVSSVREAMPIRAEGQVVLAAVLERAGYHSPDGAFYPEALTLGDVEVLEYSSTAEGYDVG